MDTFDLKKWNGFIDAGGDPSQSSLIDQIAIDSRRIYSPQSLFVALKGSYQDGHQFVERSGAKFALVEKDWKGSKGPHLLRVDDPLSAFQEIVCDYRKQLSGNVIAIIGSYGKTMVKDLLHHLLQGTFSVSSSPESFNSQIGVPMSLLQAKAEHEQVIIEAAFSFPGEMDRLHRMISPTHTILTHVGKKHMHTIGSREVIAQEMQKLYPLSASNWALLPQDPVLTPHDTTFRWDHPSADLPHAESPEEADTIQLRFPNGRSYPVQRPAGMSYFSDLLNIGVKAAYLLGVEPEMIIDRLQTYIPEPMRTEIWKNQSGTTFVNEPYCGDPQSLDCSLKHFDYHAPKGRKTLLFGGIKSEEPSTYSRIGEAIARSNPDAVLLTVTSPKLESVLQKNSPNTKILRFPSPESALKNYSKEMRPEDILIIKGKRKLPFDKLTQTVQGSIFSNQCHINLAAVASNLKLIRSQLPEGTEVMVMVKAMAYGTQDALIAKFLKGDKVKRLGVSYVDEGISLRREGVDQKIFVLNAAPFEAEKVVEWDFEIAVSDEKSIMHIADAAQRQEKKAKVHLHIDTGMSRLGCRPEEAVALAEIISRHPHLKLEGVMTHFACSDDPSQDSFTLKQSSVFDEVISAIESAGIPIPFKHACNSQATLRLKFPQYNMVRIGMALYGLCPGGTLALSLTSRIVGINHCLKGETISYGRSYTVQRDNERIAVIPIGYYDGLHLNYSGKGEVMIHGIKAPMVGQICMDYMMVDITHIPEANIGDPVLIFGEDSEGHVLSPEELAQKGGSSVYELITCLGPRIQRVFIHEENEKIT